MRKSWWTLLLVTLLACNSGPERTATVVADPSVEFTSLEERLLTAQTVRLDYRVTATGAVEAELVGELQIEGESIRLTGRGHFAGEPAELRLESDGARYTFGNASGVETADQPAHLREAIVIGLTRMGILHNLARLTGAAPPDHADGGVQDWVTVGSFRADTAVPGAVSFDLTVSGEPSGTASLEIDESGGPVRRLQTVAFPGGEMQVVESYATVTIMLQD